jgi:hypothetical protein
MRLATCLAILVAVLALLGGCGDSSEETTAPAPAAAEALTEREIRSAWEREPSCRRPPGASRWGCSVGDYRCQAVVTGRGWSVSCAKPGRSVAFTVRRG